MRDNATVRMQWDYCLLCVYSCTTKVRLLISDYCTSTVLLQYDYYTTIVRPLCDNSTTTMRLLYDYHYCRLLHDHGTTLVRLYGTTVKWYHYCTTTTRPWDDHIATIVRLLHDCSTTIVDYYTTMVRLQPDYCTKTRKWYEYDNTVVQILHDYGTSTLLLSNDCSATSTTFQLGPCKNNAD